MPAEPKLTERLVMQAPKMRRTGRSARLGGVLVFAAVAALVILLLTRGSPALLVTSFPMAKKLITNERAYFGPDAARVHKSRTWLVTSGSLFSDGGAGWTGIPDGVAPDVDSSNATDSAVFRVVTRRANFTDVTVSFQLRVVDLVTTQRTPATSYDGVHVFLRYQNDKRLYVASVFRRDGIVALKEKLPGGISNGGTYVSLAEGRYRMPMHTWVPVSVTIVTLPRQVVQLTMTIDSRTVLTATEPPSRVPPILAAGRVGLRGDNCEFFFRDFVVSATSP